MKAEKYIQLTDAGQRTTNNPQGSANGQPVLVDLQKGNAEPGEQISYNITTGFDNIWLIHSLNKMDKSNNLSFKNISNAQSAPFAVSVAEQDRGGMAMSYAFVKHNRVYKGGESFSIPWSNKDLKYQL